MTIADVVQQMGIEMSVDVCEQRDRAGADVVVLELEQTAAEL